jgi:hypothetical protein
MAMNTETRLWCEVGIWNACEPGLIIQVEEFEPDGDYREFVDVVVDMPLEFPADWTDQSDMLELPWESALESLGYVTAAGWVPTYLPNSVCFQILKGGKA